MMSHIIHLITSYLKTKKNYLDSQVKTITDEKYTLIYFCYQGLDVEICVYNDTFIKLKVDNHPHAFCDSIKTLRHEIDKLPYLRYVNG